MICDLVDHKQHLADDVMNNTTIVNTNRNWSQLEFLEAYQIRTLDSAINFGLRASQELWLFK